MTGRGENVQMYLNVLRRWLVRKLLGDGLAVEVREKAVRL